MSDHQHSEESKENERDETMKDLDVSPEEGEDVKGGGLIRQGTQGDTAKK